MWIEKYRPTTLDKIIGHENIRRALSSMILNNDIPHLLFHGMQGTGKTSAAYALAHDLLGDDADGNLVELNASGDRGIDIMKQIAQYTRLTTFNNSTRIILLDEADGMTKDAQQMLRKPLEQCNATRFILVCNNKDAIIEPLQSRCFVFEFTPISVEDIVYTLSEICDKEAVTISNDTLMDIAKTSKGDLRYAINELQKAHYTGSSEITEILKKYAAEEAI